MRPGWRAQGRRARYLQEEEGKFPSEVQLTPVHPSVHPSVVLAGAEGGAEEGGAEEGGAEEGGAEEGGAEDVG